jgi:hypothetical protein
MNQHSSSRKKYYLPLIGAALATASLFQFSLPVFAVGTNAGVSLKNTATATYENETGTPYNAVSNPVTVTVGKIAGITNVPNGLVDNTTSATNTTVLPGDSVSFDFKITNTGNDATNVFVPNATTINNNAVNVTVPNAATSVQYSINGGTSFINRPADGIIPNVALNTSIIVRVTGTVSSTANTGDNISVRLGDTGNNTADINSPDFPGTQNQPDAGGANDPQDQDVRTLTADNANTAVDGDPVNGQREASATNTVTVGSNPLALTRIRKTNAGFTDGSSATSLSDNIITYNLELDVLNQKLAGYNNFAYNPAALEGRDYRTVNAGSPSITGTGIASTSNLILISDAIPANTKLSEDVADNGQWKAVYSSSPLSTAAEKATWTSTAPANQTARDLITRVGWVYDASTNKIAAGTTQTGFSFKVVTSGLTNTATSVYNMAQTFGSTDDGNATTTGGAITFDESGDENPNNFNDDGTSGPDETVGDSNTEFGVANPGNNENNVDANNNNTATGTPAGEVNKVIVTLPAVASNLRNGPNNLPDATGGIFNASPADDNHDFQNLGVGTPTVTGTTQATTRNPAAITFNNTVKNPTAAQITDVILQPISPQALGLGGSATDLPNGTLVTIEYNDGATTRNATYTYNSSSTGSFTWTSGSGTSATNPITITSINANASIPYTVTVDLPDGTKLSTDDDGSGGNIGGYPVPIVAYKDSGTAGLDANDTYNVTVDQVYYGYLKLVKKARVLRANASGQYSVVTGMNFNDPDTNKKPAPGDIIEYQVAYRNISDPQATGANSVLLQANDVRIIENGTVGGNSNNWALDNDDPTEDGDTIIDTLHVPSSAQDSNSGTITYFKGTAGNTVSSTADKLVTSYIDTVTNVAPGVSGTFTFQRKVTDASDIKTLTP